MYIYLKKKKRFRKINYVLVVFWECSFVVGVRALFFTVHKVFSVQPQPLWVSPAQEQREKSCSSKSVETQAINYGDRSGVAFWGPQEGHNHFQMTLNTQLAVHLSRGHLNVSLRSSSKRFRHTDIRKTLGQAYNEWLYLLQMEHIPPGHQLQA